MELARVAAELNQVMGGAGDKYEDGWVFGNINDLQGMLQDEGVRMAMRPDVCKAYVESWVTHANKDRTAVPNQWRSFVSTVTLLAEAHNAVLETNDPERVVLQKNNGQMTVPGFTPVKTRKRLPARSENGSDASISKETRPKKLLSAKEMMKSGMFNALAEPAEDDTANNDEEDGDEPEIDVDEDGDSRRQSSLYNPLGKDTSAALNITPRKGRCHIPA
ncbi:hypothetical protein LTR56_025222 [Elasticomyces elasticus]|nr:hypothetical protein LTR56_025222 [Elasticomyces elasticus]KAK3637305.1 hypothetical protein LTR22_018339 [Elasticomyces elasticus]KAK4916423.1 hypothetical protein LTR49_015521 [Elasticomyces elasticus]KAK5756031.1 hypothetical protein LTS12_013920 [Elasticomyces elasticus]